MENCTFTDGKTGLKYQMIVGIETHVQVLSHSKAFCGCENGYGGIPNSRTCPICLALPGSQPRVNKRLFEAAVLAATAFSSTVTHTTGFVRKNYSYADLPKGYQITQNPQIATGGFIEIETHHQLKKINLMGLHMEEDVGKTLTIEDGTGSTYVDYNRSGTPLLEIVSQPDMASPDEAVAYAMALREIVRYIGISNGDMEEGSLRCDANINLKIEKEGKIYTTPIAEVKNMNSFKHIKGALLFEVRRQIDQWLQDGLTINSPHAVKTTRRWDNDKGETIFMRRKGVMDDYRFWPEPDLKMICLSPQWVEHLAAQVQELPLATRRRFMKQYGLSDSDCQTLTQNRALANYFEEAAKQSKNSKKVANWILTELLAYLNANNIELNEVLIKPCHIAQLVNIIEDGTINGAQAKDIFIEMCKTGEEPAVITKKLNLTVIADSGALELLADEVLAENPQSIIDYHKGKDHALKYLMGQLMKKSGGKARPDLASNLLKTKLDNQESIKNE